MRKYMLFNPLKGSPWEYPAIKNTELILSLNRIVYKTSKYSLFKSNLFKNTNNFKTEINIVKSPFVKDIFIIYICKKFDGGPTKPIKMKAIRQSRDKIELIGIKFSLDMSYADYAITIKIVDTRITQIVFHNLEREFDYEFEGSITNKSNYDRVQLKKDVPEQLDSAVRSYQRDNYKPLLEYLLAKYPLYYKIYYIIGVLVRDTYYFDEAIKLNKKFADAYDFKLAILKGEGAEKERYDTIKLLIKYKRYLSPLAMTSFPVRYLELAELYKHFGNTKKSQKYLSKYFHISPGAIPNAYYLRANLFYEMKKYNKALDDINECLKEEKNKNNYLLRSKIKEAMGNIDGSEDDKKEAMEIEENKSDWEVWD